MPEAAEVKIFADCLNDYIKGELLISIVINPKSKFFEKGGLNGDHFLEKNILQNKNICLNINSKVTNIDTKGKKIIIQFASEICIIFGLGMSGNFLFVNPDNHSGISFDFENTQVWYSDVRSFSYINICNNQAEINNVLKSVGPDLMKNELTFEEFKTKIQNPRLKKNIGDVLLDQKHFSGIGNYIRCEALYLAKIGPFRLPKSLDDDEIYVLFQTINWVIQESYKKNGLTIATYKNPNGEIGRYDCVCYDRKEDPYGNKIIKIVDKTGNKRTIHWCPTVQK